MEKVYNNNNNNNNNNRRLSINVKKCLYEGTIVSKALSRADAWDMRSVEFCLD